MTRAFIGIGSNQGDRLEQISQAIRRLSQTPQIRVVQMASIIETQPEGGPPQDNYFNTAIEIHTEHEPADLLRILDSIEQGLGRTRSAERWGPRPIDLDLLLYDDRVVHDPRLMIPHPRLHQRRFVLEPLAQLAPEVTHPILNRTIQQLLDELKSGTATDLSVYG